jgi:P-type conjugative transfer protein TrbJ
MLRRSAAILTVLILLFPAAALGWKIVFDPKNYSQNVKTALNSAKNILNQARQIQNEVQMLSNQYEMIRYYASDLESLPFSSVSEISMSLYKLDSLINNAQGLAYRLQGFSKRFNELYPKYGGKPLFGEKFKKKYGAWLQQTRDAIYNAMASAGIVTDVSRDADTLSSLVDYSQSAKGNLQALQAGNQISALMVSQLLKLETIVAANNQAVSSFMAQEASETDAAQVRADHFFAPVLDLEHPETYPTPEVPYLEK